MTEPSRFLVIGLEQLDLAIGPNREVVVRLRGLENDAGLTPGLGVMLALTPGEAHKFAEALHRTAQTAEVRDLPRA